MKVAIFPGSFDPITNGHLDVVSRAAKLFDKLIVAVAFNSQKKWLFSEEERIDIIKSAIDEISLPRNNVSVVSFKGLLVNFAEESGACAIIRGLRAISDFEFEFQMALMNRKISAKVETLFLMPREDFSYISSRIVKEICHLGGDISAFVPKAAEIFLKRKLK